MCLNAGSAWKRGFSSLSRREYWLYIDIVVRHLPNHTIKFTIHCNTHVSASLVCLTMFVQNLAAHWCCNFFKTVPRPNWTGDTDKAKQWSQSVGKRSKVVLQSRVPSISSRRNTSRLHCRYVAISEVYECFWVYLGHIWREESGLSRGTRVGGAWGGGWVEPGDESGLDLNCRVCIT